jgi:hypothetical protein
MRQYLNMKRWRLPAVAVFTAITSLAVFATASEAFAQGQPGEITGYTQQSIKNLTLQGTLAEARNGGDQVDVWRGFDNQVWVSFDHGSPYTITSTTKTFASPAVAPFGTNEFIIFHTGSDGNIYFTEIADTVQNPNFWVQVPGQTTPNTMSVSVAPMGQDSFEEFLVYRGASDDTRVFGTWINLQNQWSTPVNIGGGRALSGPSITFNNATQSLNVVAQGLDNQVWMTFQQLGSPTWPNWRPEAGQTSQSPSVAACANGNLLMSWVDSDQRPNYQATDANGNQLADSTIDLASASNSSPTNWRTDFPVQLVSSGNTVWSLFTGQNGGASYWKPVFNCS